MDVTSISGIIISLFTLTILEVVLGIDNLVFITIISNRLPKSKQKLARRVGLLLALGTRILLLAFAIWLIGLKRTLFTVFNFSFSASDLILIGGGLFLLFKSTSEIHTEFEMKEETATIGKFSSVFMVVTQIAILDIIFSLDSILTAIGLTQTFWVMALAITIAIFAMIIASEPLSKFINKYPTIKMLALSFLILIGMVLIADGFKFHIPRGYIYFAVCFSIFVEVLNTLIANRRRRLRRHIKHKP